MDGAQIPTWITIWSTEWQQLPGLLPRLMIVSSSRSNVGNVLGIASGDVDHDICLNRVQKFSDSRCHNCHVNDTSICDDMSMHQLQTRCSASSHASGIIAKQSLWQLQSRQHTWPQLMIGRCVTIHVAIGHFWFVPTLLPLHETIMSLGSNLGTHRPFNTPYSNPHWDPCTVRAWSPFPIPPHIYTTLPVYTFPHSEY